MHRKHYIPVASSNYTEDEVLFNALGYSVFETLKPKNIIFEGWADKKVFMTALASSKGKEYKGLKDFGCVHASGVKTIISVAKDLELANRAYFVLSDSDNPAKQKRKEFEEKEACAGSWYTYDELVAGIYTLEGFIKHAALKKAVIKTADKYPELKGFDATDLEKAHYRREESIKKFVQTVIADREVFQAVIAEIKNEVYSNITARDIEDSYYEFLKAVDEKLVIPNQEK